MLGIFLADLSSGGTPDLYAAAMFAVMIIASSFFYAWLRLRSASLWTAVRLHTAHNIFIQVVFDCLTGSTEITPYITGEFRAGLAISSLVVACILGWRLQFNPTWPVQTNQTPV